MIFNPEPRKFSRSEYRDIKYDVPLRLWIPSHFWIILRRLCMIARHRLWYLSQGRAQWFILHAPDKFITMWIPIARRKGWRGGYTRRPGHDS